MDKVFFKIVIPNYNNMAYIKQCLDSILEQTFQDFKIIAVDDQSTDLSDKFCEMYARKFSDKLAFYRLQKKGYAGACRNAGIDYDIQSEYTWFIDSDDYIAQADVLDKLHDLILRDHFPDLVLASVLEKRHNSTNFKCLSKNTDDLVVNGAWTSRHIVRSKINSKFIEDRAKNNDVIWFNRVLDQIDQSKISVAEFPCFIYNMANDNSCQHGKNKNSILCNWSLQKQIEDYQHEHYKSDLAIKFKQHELKKLVANSNRFKTPICLTSFFEHALMITVNDIRYETTCKIFANKLKLVPNKFNGIKDCKNSSIKNCQLSHFSCVLHAKKNNWPFVAIFEDDAYPCADIKNQLEKVLYTIPANAGCLMLGWLRDYKQKPQNFSQPYNPITTIISGAHAYMLFSSAYDEYLSFFKYHPKAPADDYVFKELTNAYILQKPLFIQYNNNSIKSMHNHIGYSHAVDTEFPPQGFEAVEETLNNTQENQNASMLNQ